MLLSCGLQVDFDEKSPLELLQVLNDVFTEFEPQMAVGVWDGTHMAGLMALASAAWGVVDDALRLLLCCCGRWTCGTRTRRSASTACSHSWLCLNSHLTRARGINSLRVRGSAAACRSVCLHRGKHEERHSHAACLLLQALCLERRLWSTPSCSGACNEHRSSRRGASITI